MAEEEEGGGARRTASAGQEVQGQRGVIEEQA